MELGAPESRLRSSSRSVVADLILCLGRGGGGSGGGSSSVAEVLESGAGLECGLLNPFRKLAERSVGCVEVDVGVARGRACVVEGLTAWLLCSVLARAADMADLALLLVP